MLPLEAVAMPQSLLISHIQLTAFDRQVYKEIKLIAVTLMKSS